MATARYWPTACDVAWCSRPATAVRGTAPYCCAHAAQVDARPIDVLACSDHELALLACHARDAELRATAAATLAARR